MTHAEKEMIRDILEACERINGTGLAEAEVRLYSRSAIIEIRLRIGTEELREDYYDRNYMVERCLQGEEQLRKLNAVRNKMHGWEKIKLDALKASKADWKIDIPEAFTSAT